MIMKNQLEVLFYLDNNDVALIEVGQLPGSNLMNLYNTCYWFIYNKATKSINRFKFKTAGIKRKDKRIKDGFLKSNPATITNKYSIEIDEHVFDFTEQHPEKLSVDTKVTIEKYMANFV